MAGPATTDDMLAHRLALDACEQWKLETGTKALSGDDLGKVKEWLNSPQATVSSFPSLRTLAVKGINALIAQQAGHTLVVSTD